MNREVYMIFKFFSNCFGQITSDSRLEKRYTGLFSFDQAFCKVIWAIHCPILSSTVKFISVILANKLKVQQQEFIHTFSPTLSMLSEQAIKTLEIKGSVPKKLEDISFSGNDSLWHKQQHNNAFILEKKAKRYEYIKIGKTLGFQTIRYISVAEDHLFYYNQCQNTDYLGYCSVENVYVQWIELVNGRFLFLISNGAETSYFYFQSSEFWMQQKQKLAKHAIQLDFQNKYEVIEELGSGSFSKVFKVQNKNNGKIFAAKVIFKLDKNGFETKKLIVEEKKLLNLMEDSDSTSKFMEFFQIEGQYIFVLEYLPGKDLMTVIKQNSEMSLDQKKRLLISLLHIVSECHQRGIIHRDIKPQNVIVDNYMRPKLIDFGLSVIVKQNVQSRSLKRCGTMGYMAPEVINCEILKNQYNSKCDIFSLGIIAHLIFVGNNPLKGKSYEKTRSLNQQCSIQVDKQKLADSCGDSCPIFLQRMLAVDSKLRYSAQDALNSQFLRESSDKESSLSTLEQKKRQD